MGDGEGGSTFAALTTLRPFSATSGFSSHFCLCSTTFDRVWHFGTLFKNSFHDGEHQKALEGQTRQTRVAEERLKQTKDLLGTKSAELSVVRAFLSATDRLSEVEVLSIVRDLNENIYQVAVNLTDEWEKSRSQDTSRMDVDPSSQPWAPSLVKRVVDRDPAGLTFLLQACLCSQVVELTSSWGHHQELSILESIYKRLSASGKHPIAVAK